MTQRLEPAAIEEWILTEHRDLVEATVAAAAAVRAEWPADRVDDRARVVEPLRAQLAERGLLEAFRDLLADCRDRYTDGGGPQIVPAPPYVVVTSRGPVLRLSLTADRLVIGFVLFAVDRGDTVEYCYRDVAGADAVCVDVR